MRITRLSTGVLVAILVGWFWLPPLATLVGWTIPRLPSRLAWRRLSLPQP
jgi:hypothetical protein